VVVTFDEVEASLLRHLVGEVADLLGPSPAGGGAAADRPPGQRPRPGTGSGRPDGPEAALLAELSGLDGPPPSRPEDPVLGRLLPDGYRDDPAAAGEFRRLTEAGLREQKRQLAAGLLADLSGDGGAEVRLDTETVERWLAGLNDVRLALGTRLNVTEDMPEPDPDHPDTAAYVVYLWLTELQEVLVQVAAEA
jgi:hypothetical protein